MDEKLKVVIVEETSPFIDGLKAVVARRENMTVVAEAGDGAEAYHAFQSKCPDLILLDLSIPSMNGPELIRQVKRLRPETRVLVLTGDETPLRVVEVFQAGADGCCTRDSNHGELDAALDRVLSGKRFISAGAAETVLKCCLHHLEEQIPPHPGGVVGEEQELLRLIAEEYRKSDIAGFLNFGMEVVKRFRKTIEEKLDLPEDTVSLSPFYPENAADPDAAEPIFEERRSGLEQRRFSYSSHVPERRSGRDRRRKTSIPDIS